MASSNSSLWLKVLIGFMLTLLLAGFGMIEAKKVDKEVFNRHETYQTTQFTDIKESLKRIEENTKK